jgi:NADH-quinone oxidoreductase subunit C
MAKEQELKYALAGLEAGPGTTPERDDAPRGAAANQPHQAVAALRSRFGAAVLQHTVYAGDEHAVYIAAERSREVLSWLKHDPGQRFDLLKDVTAVDYGGGRPLELVYELWSVPRREGLRVKVLLPLEALEADSVEPVWRTANWLEREVYDLFGIHFRGHPDLRRIMMPENYAEGHPLRKDFPLRGRFSRAEQTRRALSAPPEDQYTPAELAVLQEDRPAAAVPGEGSHAASAALDPGASPRRPNDPEHWSLGSSGPATAGSEGATP